MAKNNSYDQKTTEYCVECDCPASKHCRCCGDPLCGFCNKNDGMCVDCNRDAYEYVDDSYRYTARAY